MVEDAMILNAPRPLAAFSRIAPWLRRNAPSLALDTFSTTPKAEEKIFISNSGASDSVD